MFTSLYGIIRQKLRKEETPMTYKCGEKPGKGTYICKNCGEDEHLDQDTDKLAPCAKCHECEFTKA